MAFLHEEEDDHTVSVLNFVGKIFVVDCIKFVVKAYQYLIFLLSCSEVMVNDGYT